MILKESYLIPADKCGVNLVKVFHLYRGFNRKCSKVGDFVKSSVRKTSANNWIKKGSKPRGIIIRTKFVISNRDGNSFFFKENNVVLLKKRLTPKGKEVIGPSVRKIKRKKFILSFAGMI